MKNPTPKIIQDRPAESATPVVMALSVLIGRALDLDAEMVGYVAIVVSFAPAGVTWLVNLIRN